MMKYNKLSYDEHECDKMKLKISCYPMETENGRGS